MAKIRYGIVAMLDALGARAFSIEECKRFLSIRSNIIDKSMFRFTYAASTHNKESKNTSITDMHTLCFGDTIAFAVELIEFGNDGHTIKFPTGSQVADATFYGMWLERLSYVLGDAIRDGIKSGILLRGSLSAGEFIVHKKTNTILGPAVTDAATWYEALDGIGVLITPRAGLILDSVELKRPLNKCIIKTKAPLKAIGEKEVRLVNWANAFCNEAYDESGVRDALESYYAAISRLAIPSNVERKYAWSTSFIEGAYKI